MKIYKILQKAILFVLLVLPVPLLAQQGGTGNWLMYFGMNKIHKKVSIHSEIQYRNHTIAPINIEQLLLRTGLNFHFTDYSFTSVGYAYVAGHQYESAQSNPETEEHRIWQQLIINNFISRVKFEHRYRIEQRWVNNKYLNRFRYRLMLFCPLNKPKIEKGALFVGVYDEIFINDKKSFFDRNRLYGALGYQFNSSTSIQVGVLYQQQSDFGKGYLQIGLTYNPVFYIK